MIQHTKWEYCHVNTYYNEKYGEYVSKFELVNIIGLRAIFNTFGEEGWECFSQTPVFMVERKKLNAHETPENIEFVNNEVIYHFKRPVLENIEDRQCSTSLE